MIHHALDLAAERLALVHEVAQGQRTVAAQIDVPDLNVRIVAAEVVLLGQLKAQAA